MTPFQEFQEKAKAIRDNYSILIANNPEQKDALEKEMKEAIAKALDEAEAKDIERCKHL